jgi:hypothetical protein
MEPRLGIVILPRESEVQHEIIAVPIRILRGLRKGVGSNYSDFGDLLG